MQAGTVRINAGSDVDVVPVSEQRYDACKLESGINTALSENIISKDATWPIFVSILLFEVYFCLFVHSYNYQHDVYKNKPRFASKIQLKRTRKNIF